MTTKAWRLPAALAVLALMTAACGSGDGGPTTTAAPTTTAGGGGTTAEGRFGLPAIDPLDVPEGDIGIAGSSTVFPLSVAVVTRWIDEASAEEIHAVYQDLAERVATGKLKQAVDTGFPLEEFQDALARLEAPDRSGKVLLVP